jgi:hypothetical protein
MIQPPDQKNRTFLAAEKNKEILPKKLPIFNLP